MPCCPFPTTDYDNPIRCSGKPMASHETAMWRRVSLLNRCACATCLIRSSLTTGMMTAHCSRSLSRFASDKRFWAIMSLWRKKASGMGKEIIGQQIFHGHLPDSVFSKAFPDRPCVSCRQESPSGIYRALRSVSEVPADPLRQCAG